MNMLVITFKENTTQNRFMVVSINVTLAKSKEIFPSIEGKLKLSFTGF
jgi:hypothetical protein